jgi:hypothetical protein
MKKVLVVFLSAVMVLSLASLALGTISVSGGEMKWKYMFQGENSEGGESPDVTKVEKNDQMEGKFKVESKISDQLSAYVVSKVKVKDKTDGAKCDFFADEYAAIYTADFGTVKVGYFGYNTKGKVDILDPAIKDLKSVTGILYSNKIADTFNVDVWYTPDSHTHDEILFDNAYAVKLGYATDMWGADIAVVNTGETATTTLDKNYQDTKTGYSANAYITPIENLTAYMNYSVDQYEDVVTLIGGMYTFGNFTARVEYDLNNNLGANSDGSIHYKDSDKHEMESNLYGVYLRYKANHGVEYEFGKKLTATAKGADQKSECWVSAKVTFQ